MSTRRRSLPAKIPQANSFLTSRCGDCGGALLEFHNETGKVILEAHIGGDDLEMLIKELLDLLPEHPETHEAPEMVQ